MCRSTHDLQLMQRANDITVASYRDVYPKISAGMTPADMATLIRCVRFRVICPVNSDEAGPSLPLPLPTAISMEEGH